MTARRCVFDMVGTLALGVAALGFLPLADAARLQLRTAGQQGWETCAQEGSPIKAGARGDTGAKQSVKFGRGQDWVVGQLASGSPCSAAAFGGDPAPGVRKVCMCSAGSPEEAADEGLDRREELGVEWTRCANEGDACACPSGRVRFGADGRWAIAEHAGTAAVKCDAVGVGADPAFQKRKECWCASSAPQVQRRQARSAIVMLSRHPPDFSTWLRYHLDYMGVERVFVEVEDTPRFGAIWSSLPPEHQSRVTVWHPEAATEGPRDGEHRPSDDYETLQARQLSAMSRAKDEASAAGIQWLIHIDDDELLWSPTRRPVADVLGALPEAAEQAYIPNVEAVYPSAEIKNCFRETKEVNMNRYEFVSYANGKAAVRLDGPDGEFIQPAGPHLWREVDGFEPPSIRLDEEPFGSPLYVVHFESCPFSRWEDKFWELGNTDRSRMARIPFRFYRESIERMQHCAASVSNVSNSHASASPSSECSEQELKGLWSRWKTEANPKLTRKDLMPIAIPWQEILSAAPGR